MNILEPCRLRCTLSELIMEALEKYFTGFELTNEVARFQASPCEEKRSERGNAMQSQSDTNDDPFRHVKEQVLPFHARLIPAVLHVSRGSRRAEEIASRELRARREKRDSEKRAPMASGKGRVKCVRHSTPSGTVFVSRCTPVCIFPLLPSSPRPLYRFTIGAT